VLLATRAKILLAPAMNSAMWANKATQRNLQLLAADGVQAVGPNEGEMAEAGEAGRGRMAGPTEIAEAAMRLARPQAQPLKGKRVLITSGPTHEPIDPVRYIANRPSGKQGHAIAVRCRRRRRHAGERPGDAARSAGRHRDPCRIRPRHAERR
jgi:phosphopantothenoylcysteine decarboxylase/phosphopantothenate--cysteine ligase